MAGKADAPSRMDLLLMSSLARAPMHGYELKLELQYKHVKWWAKCEHGHLYAALKRLEKRGLIKGKSQKKSGRTRRVYTITAAGRRWIVEAIRVLGRSDDSTYFDVDLFLSAAFVLDRADAITILRERADRLDSQREEADALRTEMTPYVPAVGRLVMDHRVEHLAREAAFARTAADALYAEAAWGPHLQRESIVEFVRRTQVPLEEDD